MTLGDAVGLSETRERLLVRALQTALAGLVAYGAATLRVGIAINGTVALAVTLVPAVLRREYDYVMDAGLVLWVTVAVFLHSVGTVGLYARYPWYDEVTHTLSATVVAGVGYTLFRAVECHSDYIGVPSEFRVAFVVVFVLAAGVAWEIVEFASEGIASVTGAPAPLLVAGVDDIVTDMIFNAVGAALVAFWGTDHVRGLVGFLRHRLDSRER